ncbi:MAG TPA: hypothetical protein PK295_01475 [Candidatus Magasanikbacteria bacterium]|nr:hypothetical protein [Candidatus Magasanikbacteria bacterium]
MVVIQCFYVLEHDVEEILMRIHKYEKGAMLSFTMASLALFVVLVFPLSFVLTFFLWTMIVIAAPILLYCLYHIGDKAGVEAMKLDNPHDE